MEEKTKYEIRIYNKRHEMNPDYYTGTKGIRLRWRAKTPNELIGKWFRHLDRYEGDTYSIWDGDDCIIGGAYDPSDYSFLIEYFKNNTEIGAEQAEGFWKDLMGMLWGDPNTKVAHGIMSTEMIADYLNISESLAESYLRVCVSNGITDRQGGGWVV